jgi:hypothetical protein
MTINVQIIASHHHRLENNFKNTIALHGKTVLPTG